MSRPVDNKNYEYDPNYWADLNVISYTYADGLSEIDKLNEEQLVRDQSCVTFRFNNSYDVDVTSREMRLYQGSPKQLPADRNCNPKLFQPIIQIWGNQHEAPHNEEPILNRPLENGKPDSLLGIELLWDKEVSH